MAQMKTDSAGIARSDMALVERALVRDAGACRLIIKTYNQRLYRLARSIVRNDGEAEDVLQEAYMRALLSTFPEPRKSRLLGRLRGRVD